MYIIVDIDHTLANSFWRDHMIGNVPWDEYHEESKYDKPFQNVIDLIKALAMQGYHIVAVTGRTEKHRGITVNWLIKNNVHIHDLLMRPDDIFLKNSEMKINLITKYVGGNMRLIDFLIDDNEETILAFQKLGITTLQIRNIGEQK